MVKAILENSIMIKDMDKVHSHGLTVEYIKEVGLRESNTEWGSLKEQTES